MPTYIFIPLSGRMNYRSGFSFPMLELLTCSFAIYTFLTLLLQFDRNHFYPRPLPVTSAYKVPSVGKRHSQVFCIRL